MKDLGESGGGGNTEVSGTGAVRRNGAHDEFREQGGVRPKNVWTVSRGVGVGIVFKAGAGFTEEMSWQNQCWKTV